MHFPAGRRHWARRRDGGTNFAVASSVAEGAEVCLFDEAGAETRVELRDYLDGSDAPDTGPDGQPLLDDDFLVLVNAWWEPVGPRSVLVFRGPRAARTAG